MYVQLSEDLSRFVRAQLASGRYASEEEVLRDVRQWISERGRDETASKSSPGGKPTGRSKRIWEVAAELRRQVPDEEWQRVPSDGAANLDHYLYGHPKRSS